MSETNMEQIAAVLYSRKMTRTNFEKVRQRFKKQTGKDICPIIDFASRDLMRQIKDLAPSKQADKLRTMMFKMVDYEQWMNFCPRKQ